MAFQETGTRILHDLGILDTTIKSPHRVSEDGNLPQTSTMQESKRNKDESTQRLIDSESNIPVTAAPPSRHSDMLFKELAIYIFALISILSVWLLIASLTHINVTLKIENVYQLSWLPTSVGIGTLLGSYLIIPLLLRVYTLFTIQFFASIAIGVSLLQYSILNFHSLLLVMGFLGVALGVIERLSYLYIHRVLQNSKRKVLFFYAVLAFGIIFANWVTWNSAVSPQRNILDPIPRGIVKREVGLPAENLSISYPFDPTTTYRPTKPLSAIGTNENQETKTAENAEKRKLAELQKEGLINTSATNCHNTSNPENCTTTTTSTTAAVTSTSTTTTTTTTTTTPPTTTASLPLIKDSNTLINKYSLPSEPMAPSSGVEPSDPVPRNRNRFTENNKVSPKPLNTVKENSQEDPSSLGASAGILVIFLLILINIAGFACNHLWCKETVVTLYESAETFQQPSSATRITSIVLWFLSDFLSSGFLSLHPFIYAFIMNKATDEHTASYGIFIWAVVFCLRLFMYFFSDFAISKRFMRIIVFSSFLCLFFFFALEKDDTSFLIFVGIGAIVSNLSIIITLYQQTAMNLSPYTTSGRYMLWSSFGRICGPLFMGKILANNSYQTLANLILLILIVMIITLYYFSKNVTISARQQQLQELNMDVSSPQSNNATNSTGKSTSNGTSKVKTRKNGSKYSLIQTQDTDSADNCLISDSEEDELFSL